MPRRPQQISPGAAEQMVLSSIGDGGGLSILELMKWVFGKKRTVAALKHPNKDPEFVQFALLLDAQVNKAWKERGINRRQGPYVTAVASDV